MKQYKFMGVSLAAMVVLAGCVDPSTMTEPEREVLRGDATMSDKMGGGVADFGNAVRANMASQIVDPAPAYALDPPKVDGQVIISAYGRYRTGKVKVPESAGNIGGAGSGN
jgi:hypothetical protein